MTRSALFEMGFWGLPVPAFATADSGLAQICRDQLNGEGLPHTRVQCCTTGRRLAWVIDGLPDQSPVRAIEMRGPKASLAYDFNGTPTQALYGFASDQGVEMNSLFIRQHEGEQYLFVRKQQAGMTLDKYLPAFCDRLLVHVPWRDAPWSHNSKLPSPPAWVVLMLDDIVVEITIDGQRSGRCTQAWTGMGFRPLEVPHVSAYSKILETAGIDPTPEQRHKVLSLRLMEALQTGETRQRDQDVLERVIQRFECPTPRVFDLPPSVRDLPERVAACALASIGDFLPVYLSKGGLANRAIAFAEATDDLGDGLPLWTATFEQILKAVVRDWHTTAETALAEQVVRLMEIPASDTLGSLYERALRLSRLCRWLSVGFGTALPEAKVDSACMMLFVERFTPLGRRFPELSGVLISLLAEKQHIDAQVAEAVTEWWQATRDPATLPAGALGRLLWAAELLDQTLQAVARDQEQRRWLPISQRLVGALGDMDWSGDLLTVPTDLLGGYSFGRGGESPLDRCRAAFRDGMRKVLESLGAVPERLSWLLDSPVLNPAGVAAVGKAWQESWPATLPAIASLYQRLQKRLAESSANPGEVVTGPLDRPHETALAARLEGLRGRTWCRPIEALEALTEMRADVEACLIDLPPVVNDDDINMRQRLQLLAHIMPLFVPLGTLKLPTPTTGEEPVPTVSPSPAANPERRSAE